MKYQIRHRTFYRYEEAVTLSQNQLRLTPMENSKQTLLSFQLHITPEPDHIWHKTDYFGAKLHGFDLQVSHSMLEVVALSEVLVNTDFNQTFTSSLPWEQVVQQIQNPVSPEQIKASEFILPSPYIKLHTEIKHYMLRFFTNNKPLTACIKDLMQAFYQDFTYESGATSLDTPLTEVLVKRKGVCQDFAHFCISGLRSLGLACRYVSGYLETLPPPGAPKLAGADASHAWCSVYCPNAGWIDFDPTNNLFPTHQHITVAIGRDFADVSPLKGILHGGGRSHLQVAVDVNRELELP